MLRDSREDAKKTHCAREWGLAYKCNACVCLGLVVWMAVQRKHWGRGTHWMTAQSTQSRMQEILHGEQLQQINDKEGKQMWAEKLTHQRDLWDTAAQSHEWFLSQIHQSLWDSWENGVGYLIILKNYYRYTSEMLWVQCQTATTEGVPHKAGPPPFC